MSAKTKLGPQGPEPLLVGLNRYEMGLNRMNRQTFRFHEPERAPIQLLYSIGLVPDYLTLQVPVHAVHAVQAVTSSGSEAWK
jgi:hypothetical protein